MKKLFLEFWYWLQNPETITGILLLACGIGGIWTTLIPPELASGLIGASIPKLIRNRMIVKILQASVIPAIAAISRRPNSK